MSIVPKYFCTCYVISINNIYILGWSHANWSNMIQTIHKARETTMTCTCIMESQVTFLLPAPRNNYHISSSYFHSHTISWKLGKQGYPISIGTMRWDLDVLCVLNGPSLPLDPTPYFLLWIKIKYGRSMTMEIETLIDSSASMCFTDKEPMWRHKMILVKKSTPITTKVINDWSIFFRHVTHETKALDITIRTHTNNAAFNVISSPTNPIVIGLSTIRNLVHFNPKLVTTMQLESKLTIFATIFILDLRVTLVANYFSCQCNYKW